jgi:hypothetical protein
MTLLITLCAGVIAIAVFIFAILRKTSYRIIQQGEFYYIQKRVQRELEPNHPTSCYVTIPNTEYFTNEFDCFVLADNAVKSLLKQDLLEKSKNEITVIKYY